MTGATAPPPPHRVLVLVNPGSGRLRGRRGLRLPLPPGARVCEVDEPRRLAAVLEEWRASPPELIAVAGGDGTVAALFAALLECPPFPLPPLALLPAGTANMTAGDVGVPGGLERAARRLSAWLAGARRDAPRRLTRHVLRLAGAGATPRYGMFLGTGAVIQGTEYAHRRIHARGLRDGPSVALAALRTLWGVARGDPRFDRPLQVALRGDGRPLFSGRARVLVASTLERLAMGLKPFWGTEDGPIRTTLVADGARGLLCAAPGILRGRPSRRVRGDGGYLSANLHRLELSLQGLVNLDGELVAADATLPLEVSARGPVTFLVPP
ncbi:MAG: diacylglycerol kinase [Porticoccaceae bacterium]|nr:MAG: diacylglycerol kinase [Porticoccaceae bacterium]